ncbi:MAG: precorrin-6y C5,15-methyltransferase (decarboxylating) subunit CbiE, partial [Massilibacteroides sp.]|nr:precorrin-6y C5,15-methyltransferase (decarboxylating) subunit CbiE [Massilibacteroides sp.]MDD4406346.1 precorrin-6y C5,15-methyltransferase (decarboxylating) subunit CbiE [Parabacteroides sp.]
MKFFVIGIDDNKDQHFSKEIMQVIQANSVFSGGKRHYEIVRRFLPHNADWIEIAIPLDLVFSRYEKYKKVVVFVSGDPLFFGFANTIQTKMPDAEIVLYPFFNSLQLLAHRLLMSYQDMHIVSLTGRSWQKFDEALILGYEKIGILTDNNKHTPAEIVRRML